MAARIVSCADSLTHPGAMSDELPCGYLVRHGETAWSLSRQHTGRADIPLTERGEAEARALAPRLRDVQFVKVFCSPLVRARRTAELAGFADRLEIDPDLMEWNYGEYEGRRTSEIRKERPGWNPFIDGCPMAKRSGNSVRESTG